MIISFRNRATAHIAAGVDNKQTRHLLPIALHRNALLKLALLNRAKTLGDLFVPGLRLEKLKGGRRGQHSVRINDQFRICFVWKQDGVHDVEIVDYHQ